MKILEVRPVTKNDFAAKKNQEIVPKKYYCAIFQHNEKNYIATIRSSTNHIAECRNEENGLVKLQEETQRKIIAAVNEYNKRHAK